MGQPDDLHPRDRHLDAFCYLSPYPGYEANATQPVGAQYCDFDRDQHNYRLLHVHVRVSVARALENETASPMHRYSE